MKKTTWIDTLKELSIIPLFALFLAIVLLIGYLLPDGLLKNLPFEVLCVLGVIVILGVLYAICGIAVRIRKIRAKKGKTVRLVDNITMRIEPASFVGIVGGSGAGKSTFVDCINGRRPCTSGKIYYDTNDFYQNMYCYQSVIGYVPQKDILHENLPLIDSLRYTASMRIKNGVSKKEIDELVKKVIQEVKLEGKEHLKISMLSGGQKKRVSIAMELLSNPKIIFCHSSLRLFNNHKWIIKW